jgi:anaerobic dimethyl sulfoxide reductase subunit A
MGQNNFLKETLENTVLNRRSFLKWSAALGGSAALVGGGLSLGLNAAQESSAGTKVVWSSCNVNCGSRCPLRLFVEDGQIVRVETDNTGDDEYGTHQVRACVRGRTIRQRVYNPDRLKYPMKRVGPRGSGEFEQISWEEALDTIADSIERIVDEYGNEAIYINYATGTLGGAIAKSWPPGASPFARLMNTYGGYLNHYGTYSAAQIAAAGPYTFGGWAGNNSMADIVNSNLVVLWGDNPGATRMSGGGIIYDLQHAMRNSNAKLINIDPRYSDTAVTVADQWVPIRPGTDAALVSALAYVMITEDLVDQEFLDKYTVGYDEDHMPEGVPEGHSYKSYILGKGPDKTAKTPQWASSITGIPVATIEQLAHEMALNTPVYHVQGWGIQRQANGEQACRAVFMPAILTGQVGLQGGGTGAREGGYSIPFARFPTLENPVETSISVFLWTDAIFRATEMTALADGVRGKDRLDVPIKFIWNYAGNTLVNQHSDHQRTAEVLGDDSLCEMIVVIDNHMTSSAKFADILLPDLTNFEQPDLIPQGSSSAMGYAIFASQAIEPMYECRGIYEICSEIAKRLGVEEEFTEGRTQDEWIRWMYEGARENLPALPEFETMKQMGIYKQANPGDPPVAYKSFREDPAANPLGTPSGLIEIFSERLHEIGETWELPEGDLITGIPIYVPTWEGPSDPLRETYPLQMIGHHYKQRTHSTYGNVPWMQEAAPQVVWLNSMDAKERGIEHGDMIRVFNDRGQVVSPAKVTPRIMPGVVSIPQGAWYAPNEEGVDEGGSVNTLTSWKPSPLAKGNPQHTNLVEVEKA